VKRKSNVQDIADNDKCKKRKVYLSDMTSDKLSSNMSTPGRVLSKPANVNLVCETNTACTAIDQPSEHDEKVSVNAAQHSGTSLHKVSVPNGLSRFETFEPFVKAISISIVCSSPTSNISSQSQTNSFLSKVSLVSCSQSIVTASNVLSNMISVDKSSSSVELPHSIVVLTPLPQNSAGSTVPLTVKSNDFEQGRLPLEPSINQQPYHSRTVQQAEISDEQQDYLHMNDTKNILDVGLETPDPSTTGDQKKLVGVPSSEVSCKEKVDLPRALTNRLFIHWANSEAICWLDVAMAMIVHCNFIRKAIAIDSDASCISSVRRLIKDYDRAQADFRRSSKLNRCHYLCGQGKLVKLETSVGHITVKTGGGGMGDHWVSDVATLSCHGDSVATIDVDDISGILSDSDPSTTSVERVSREARRLDDQAKQILIDVREYMFEVMQRKLFSQRGQNDSALLALSTLLAEDPFITEQLLVKYSFKLTCNRCQHVESNW